MNIVCEIGISLDAWKLEDDIFDHVTMLHHYERKKDNTYSTEIVMDFTKSISLSLNLISFRSDKSFGIWSARANDAGMMNVKFMSSNDDMSVGSFIRLIKFSIVPLLRDNIVAHGHTVHFDESWIDYSGVLIRAANANDNIPVCRED